MRSERIVPTAEAGEWMRDDLPDSVKMRLRLAVRGGRQQRRRCLGCGAPGIYLDVFVPHAALRVGGDPEKGVVTYWTCPACHEAGLTPELQKKLVRR